MNRLRHASSPYLRQHAENPVDWREWGDEAFREAAERDVPVFLSVGYASCHWCHVMAHESFEDDGIARVLNSDYVPVKVDREERPDVDSVYMGAVQAMTGQGGWPMSVFLTPDRRPFFAGTYWPKESRHGMPGFVQVLAAVGVAWEQQRNQVLESSARITEHLASARELPSGGQAPVDERLAERAAQLAVRAWDREHGGFGAAPKFPQAMTIDFLLAHHVRTGDDEALRAAMHSLEAMSRGGIHDQVGGGFARYSVDAFWLVPHFEKMLYDNALLLRAYTHAWQVTGSARFRRVARATADFLLGELRHPEGGFCSSFDADSEGREGRFYVWRDEEFRALVAGAGEDPDTWARLLGVTPQGNFRDPHHPEDPPATVLSEVGELEGDAAWQERWQRVRAALLSRRRERVPPGLDDKVLTSWNGLAIGALAEAGAALGEPRYVHAAETAAAFIRAELVRDGRLQHTWREGHGPSVPAFLEDVAFLAQGLLSLYEADLDPSWLAWVQTLAEDADARFTDEAGGGWFATADDGEELLTRPKELWDNATPSGSSVMVDVHLRLGALTGDQDHTDRAERALEAFAPAAMQAPTGFGELLRGLERRLGGPREVAVVGDRSDARLEALLNVYRSAWRPASVLAAGPDEHVALLAGRGLVQGRPAAYVCRDFTCERPVTEPEELATLLGA
ncbi:MAG: thioredoxin domain-containing protein [Egibacteraceae bacterium]